MENIQEENEPIYKTVWNGRWVIYKLTCHPKDGFYYKVWLTIDGEQDDEKVRLLIESLNQPPIEIIQSHMEGALNVEYENDQFLWSHVKHALQNAFAKYASIFRETEKFISKHQSQILGTNSQT